MIRFGKHFLAAVILAAFSFSGCVKPDKQNPDTDASLYYLINAFPTWYNALYNYRGPGVPMAVMADQVTWDFANFGYAQKFGGEPRLPFANYYKSPDTYFIDRFWISAYEALNYVNLTLQTLEQGGLISGFGPEDENMIRSWCYFLQGVIHGYLGLIFDKAVIQDEFTDPMQPVLSEWPAVLKSAVSSLDKSIQISGQGDFIIPDTWYSGPALSAGDLAGISSTFAAMFLAYGSRNAAQNDSTKWSLVESYAQSGIKSDFMIITDQQIWVNSMLEKAIGPGYGRVDNRVIHLFDSTYPAHYPADGLPPDPPDASSADARLDNDFEYLSTINFAPENGTYLFSNYRLKKYDDWLPEMSGAIPFVTKTENDLLYAEALVRTGNTSEAINILNSSTRIKRGHLPLLDPAATNHEVLEAIFYEREVELIGSGIGTAFYDMRRRDMLQKGTLLHFPVPAEELDIMGLPVYSFGGEDHADGVNTSNGGW
ncbi:MAG: RagB/SusD family nutrient uptake outer membrane protein [Chlorobi bacterium]|nr:RagB/SusD family nutrient uptake outer membrane protein [Chlorobiota bacterium]